MKTKRILMFIMIGALLLGTASCSSNNTSTQIEGVKVGLINDKGVNKITIPYLDNEQDIIASAILQYNQKYTNVKIEGICIPVDSFEEYKTKLSTEILTGEGPDLLYFSPDYFNSFHKAITSGAFCDLNQLISKDTGFKMSDYNKKVMDYGVLDGKRYFIPLAYSPRVFATSKKALEKNNVNIDESGWTWNELGEIVNKFMASNKGKNRYFFDSYFNFNAILGSYPKSFIDYKMRRSLFDCKEFREMLKIYKGIFSAIETEDIYRKYNQNPAEAMSKNEVLLYTDSNLNPGWMSDLNARFLESFGEEVEYIPFPYPDKSGKFIPSFYSLISINAKCKEKMAAFNFIKILLSKEIQSTSLKYYKIKSGSFWGTPVNNKVMKDDLLYLTGKNDINPPLSERLISQFLDMTQHVEKGELIDSQIYKAVDEAVKEYVNNTKTEDQTIQEINSKVELFLNE